MKSFLMQFKLIVASILQTTYKQSLGSNIGHSFGHVLEQRQRRSLTQLSKQSGMSLLMLQAISMLSHINSGLGIAFQSLGRELTQITLLNRSIALGLIYAVSRLFK